jgi:GT2 family glycosyltransferase
MIDVSVITVNYNVKEFVLNLVISLKKALSEFTYEIIVVDNASQDGSVEYLKEKFTDVTVIANSKNVGFGKANNQALEISKGKYILLINPDAIVREDTFTKMISFFERTKEAGLAGCKVLNPNGTLQLACRRGFPGPWTSFTKVSGLSTIFPKSKLFAKYNLTYLDENKTYEVDAISGSFMMLKRDVYEKVGGFDPDFFMYGEDLDLCYRIQKAGYKVYYVHDTEVIHYKGESTKRSSIDETKMFYDAMQIFVKKHLSTSFIVTFVLGVAINLRKFIAFLNIYKISVFSIIVDGLFYSGGVYIAEQLYRNEHWVGFPEIYKPAIYFVPSVVQIIISLFSGAYRKKSFLILKSWLGLIIGLFVITSLTFFLKQYAFSRAVVLITFIISLFSFSIWRIILKVFFKIGVGENKNTKTLIVGTSEKAASLGQKLKSNLMVLNNIIGLISVTPKEIGEEKGGFTVLGTVENIKKIIIDKKVEKVIFSSDEISFEQIFAVVSSCRDLSVDFLVSGEEHDYLVGKSSITVLKDIPLLKVHYNISSWLHKTTKRLFDFTVSLLILLVIYPFIYLISKTIKLNTPFVKVILAAWEVFIGRKSFVGPKSNNNTMGLYLGKQGLTGLWFTELQDDSDKKETEKLDLFYAKNQNIWLDIEILGKTLSKFFIN